VTNHIKPNVFGYERLHEAKSTNHKRPQCFGHECGTLDLMNELEWQDLYIVDDHASSRFYHIEPKQYI
jgi:hypothetical protein